MNNSFLEVLVVFVVFLIVDTVLLFMIARKKHKMTPLTLKDAQGKLYTVTTPGKIETGTPSDRRP